MSDKLQADGGETPTPQKSDSERCEGCEERRELTVVEMEYGGQERLCDDCISESWDVIAGSSSSDSELMGAGK